jgi:hypothetical protein
VFVNANSAGIRPAAGAKNGHLTHNTMLALSSALIESYSFSN